MPYIKQERRDQLDDHIDDLVAALKGLPDSDMQRKGDVNYTVCRIINELFPANRYGEISEGIAALKDAAVEIERRRMAPREDQAIEQNGDIKGFGLTR
jgi:hypothetical protein